MQYASNHYQTLHPAAQQQNMEKDQAATSPYLNSSSMTLEGIASSLSQVGAVVRLAYDKATPAQKTVLYGVQRDLRHAYNSTKHAQRRVDEVKHTHGQALSKDGKSQFQAAARSDARSMETQIANQNRRREHKPQNSVSLPTDKQTPIEAVRGKAKTEFNRAEGNQPGSPPAEKIHSQQVAQDQPKPELRPSLEMGGSVDRAAHNEKKSADHQASRDIPPDCVKLPKSLQQGSVSSSQQQAAKGVGIGR